MIDAASLEMGDYLRWALGRIEALGRDLGAPEVLAARRVLAAQQGELAAFEAYLGTAPDAEWPELLDMPAERYGDGKR